MESALRQKLVVQPGGVIEIRSSKLPVGAVAEVIVIWEQAETESLGWPSGFFEQFAGSLPEFPDIEPEGEYEAREEMG